MTAENEAAMADWFTRKRQADDAKHSKKLKL
jgi:hypothetical protein